MHVAPRACARTHTARRSRHQHTVAHSCSSLLRRSQMRSQGTYRVTSDQPHECSRYNLKIFPYISKLSEPCVSLRRRTSSTIRTTAPDMGRAVNEPSTLAGVDSTHTGIAKYTFVLGLTFTCVREQMKGSDNHATRRHGSAIEIGAAFALVLVVSTPVSARGSSSTWSSPRCRPVRRRRPRS